MLLPFLSPRLTEDYSLVTATVLSPQSPGEPSGSWDSIHVFEAAERGRQAHYKLTSTIMLQMVDRSASTRGSKEESPAARGGRLVSEKAEAGNAKRDGEVTLSGSMTRQGEQDFPLQDQASHITNTGRMIEEMELKMRNQLQEVRCLALQLLHLAAILHAPLEFVQLGISQMRFSIGLLRQDSRCCFRPSVPRRP